MQHCKSPRANITRTMVTKNLFILQKSCTCPRRMQSFATANISSKSCINAAPRNIHYDNSRDNRNLAIPRNAGLICQYCKIPGHSLEQCRKRQYNNNLRNRGNQIFNREYPNSPNQRLSNRENRVSENQRERVSENSGNRDRAQRTGAALNERPRMRLVTQDESQEGTCKRCLR